MDGDRRLKLLEQTNGHIFTDLEARCATDTNLVTAQQLETALICSMFNDSNKVYINVVFNHLLPQSTVGDREIIVKMGYKKQQAVGECWNNTESFQAADHTMHFIRERCPQPDT